MKTKKLFMVAFASLLFAGNSFAQSHSQGTIQAGLGWGLAFGGASITSDDGTTKSTGNGAGAVANFGIRGQYGLTDNISAGIYLRSEAATYVVTLDDLTSGVTVPDVSYAGTAFGLEGKYYLANSDGFNFYPSLSIGYTSGDNTINDITFGDSKTSLSGINWALGAGFNWYFIKDVFGLSMDLTYQSTNLSGTRDAEDASKAPTDITVKNSGLYWGMGITAHFGGN